MMFKTVVAAALVSMVAAAPQTGGTCFDAGDCLIQGGGNCVKSGLSIVGTCSSSSGTGTSTGGFALPSGLSLPSGFSLPSFVKRQFGAGSGGICFDAGDCLIQGGGNCVHGSGLSITGTCQSGSSTGTSSGGFALPSGLSLPTGLSLPAGLKREAEAEQ